MSLYRYFAKSSNLPDLNGELSASVSPAAIKDANEAVKSVTCEKKEQAKRELLQILTRASGCDREVRIFKRQPSGRSTLF